MRSTHPTLRASRTVAAFALAASMTAAACASSQSASGAAGGGAASAPNYVQLVTREADRRVDVLVGGQPFTSYMWPASQMKPIVFPLRSASGVVVTRGFPLEPRAKERIDHPHHAGLWFNYGDVNGLDFWNNSTAIPAAQAAKYGTIHHRSIRSATSGAGQATLDVTSEWMSPAGKALLREDTRYVFRAENGTRAVERITTLTALDTTVNFRDNKEGVLGLRVAKWLEHPSLKPERYTDASGKVTDVAVLDTAGVHGLYTSSEGRQGDAVWGTRSKWTMLTGDVSGSQVTVAILDHPQNVGYPTYWHARGYGLFSANPLGQKEMSGGKETLNFSLPAGKSTTFRHQVLILDGKASPADLEKRHVAFSR